MFYEILFFSSNEQHNNIHCKIQKCSSGELGGDKNRLLYNTRFKRYSQSAEITNTVFKRMSFASLSCIAVFPWCKDNITTKQKKKKHIELDNTQRTTTHPDFYEQGKADTVGSFY